MTDFNFPIHIINSGVVLSLEDKIDEINKDAEYEYKFRMCKFDENIYKALDKFYSENENAIDTLLYVGEYPKFDNCKLFIAIEHSYDKYVFIYIVGDYYKCIEGFIYSSDHITSVRETEGVVKGFISLCELFLLEYLEYRRRTQLSSFMYLPSAVIKIEDSIKKETKKENDDEDWVVLGTSTNLRYTLLLRGDLKMVNEKDVECDCPFFFLRNKREDKCEHIQQYLYLSDEVPEGELVPEDCELTPEGKDFVVRFRVKNDLDIFKV